MPVQRGGDVQISPLPSSSTYRRFPLSTSYGYRSSSLDRSSSSGKLDFSSTTYTSSYLPPSSFTASRPPRPLPHVEISSSRNLDIRKLGGGRVAKFEVSSHKTSSSLSSSRRHGVSGDTLGSPVLTRYRELSDNHYLESSSLVGRSRGGRAASPGANSNHSSASSSSYDENFNPRISSRTTEFSDKKTVRPWHTDSSSSSSDYSPSPQRTRRNSAQFELKGYSPITSSSRESLALGDLENGTSAHLPKDGPPSGLRNLGNTCFMNAVIQCLCHTPPILDYCLRNGFSGELNHSSPTNGELMKAFAALVKSLWCGGGSAVSPNAFRSQVARLASRFVGYSQQDAQEFLRYLLPGLHEDINRVISRPRGHHALPEIQDNLSDNMKAIESWKRYLRFDDSSVVDTFVGQLKSSLKCNTCKYDSVTFDPFWDLSLPIPKIRDPVTLDECLALFTKEEVLDGEEKPTCSKCKEKRTCVKSFSIFKFPRILVLHLKRFSPYEKYRTKLETMVQCPQTLDLSPYASPSSQGRDAVYSLFAIANHSGGTYSGHYTATCRHPTSSLWYEFNDARVTRLYSDNVVTSKAYVLFYELNSTQSSRL